MKSGSEPAGQPQYSADGRWWWNGSSWVPVHPAVPSAPRAGGSIPGWLAIPGLIVFVPAGLVLTWLTRWSTPTKLIASGVAVVMWIGLITAVVVAGLQSPKSLTSQASASPVSALASSPTPTHSQAANPSPLPSPTATGRSVAGKVTVVHPSQPLKVASAPGGEFSIAIPAGWVINPSQDGKSFTITPAGQTQPSIGIFAGIPVSDLRATEVAVHCAQSAMVDALSCSATELSDQMADSQRAWPAGDAFTTLLQYLTQVSTVQYGAPTFAQQTPASTNYEVRKQAGGVTLDDWGIIAMGYINNPAFQVDANPAYTSLAFVTGCEAAAEQASSMRSICKQALDSLRPSPTWLQDVAKRQMQTYQNEFAIIQQQLANERQFQQMIARFQSNMRQMQVDEFNAMQKVDARVGDGWHAALGGQVNMQDKNGNVYLLDNGYQSYCLTNISNVFESTGYLSRGDTFSGESCAQILGSATA
jgi:hypothetical protein